MCATTPTQDSFPSGHLQAEPTQTRQSLWSRTYDVLTKEIDRPQRFIVAQIAESKRADDIVDLSVRREVFDMSPDSFG